MSLEGPTLLLLEAQEQERSMNGGILKNVHERCKSIDFGFSVTSPRRAAFAAADAGDRGASASGAIGGAPATNPSMAAGATGAAAGTATRRTLAEAESPLDDRKSSAAGDGDLPQSLKGDTKRFLSTEEQGRTPMRIHFQFKSIRNSSPSRIAPWPLPFKSN